MHAHTTHWSQSLAIEIMGIIYSPNCLTFDKLCITANFGHLTSSLNHHSPLQGLFFQKTIQFRYLDKVQSYGSFTLHGTGTGTGTGKWWVIILCNVLYTLHRDRDRDRDRYKESLFSIVPTPVPVPVPVPVPCSVFKPLRLFIFFHAISFWQILGVFHILIMQVAWRI